MEKENFQKLVKRLTLTDETDDCSDETVNGLILDSFNKLSKQDRADIIRRGAVKPNETAEDTVNEIVSQLSKKQTSVEDLNQMELIRLKSWLIKTITITALICFLIFLVLMVFINGQDSNGANVSDYFIDFMKIVNLLIFNES